MDDEKARKTRKGTRLGGTGGEDGKRTKKKGRRKDEVMSWGRQET